MPAKGAVGGLFAGIALAFWAGTGSFIYPAPPTKSLPLPLSTLNCTLANSTEALTTAAPTAAPARYRPCPRLYPTLRHGAARRCSVSGAQAATAERAGSTAHCQTAQRVPSELRFDGAAQRQHKRLCRSCLVALVPSSQAFAGRYLVLPVLPVLQCHRLPGLCHHGAPDQLPNRLVFST